MAAKRVARAAQVSEITPPGSVALSREPDIAPSFSAGFMRDDMVSEWKHGPAVLED